MSTQTSLPRSVHAAVMVVAMSVMGSVAWATEPPKTSAATVSKETREKMAVLHEQMAACLRSDKSISDCHAEMRKNCQTTLGTQDCPMMGRSMHSGGMHEAPGSPQ
jgi:hypothetical protein